MTKTIQVKTDDPEKKKFSLVLKGPVESVVDITPPSVYLEGKTGESLSTDVTIRPSVKFPFSILDVKTRNNTPIQINLIKPKGEKDPWMLNVKAVSEIPNNLYDVIQITTDSKYKPTLTIRVYVVFVEKKDEKKVPVKS